MLKQCLICIFVFIIFYTITSSEKDYGPFHLAVNKIEMCKGPKHKNCCIVRAKMLNKVNLSYNIQILENVIPTKGKILALSNGQPLVRLQLKNPCEHLFMGPLFRSVLNVSQDCTFRKGNYSFYVDIEDYAQKYYGGMFLYGNISFMSLFYTDRCNFSCTLIEINIFPKSNKTSM